MLASMREELRGFPYERKQKKKKSRAAEQAELVEDLVGKLKTKLGGEEYKGSLGDLIRLLQLQRELAEEQPTEIKVTWVEPAEEGSET